MEIQQLFTHVTCHCCSSWNKRKCLHLQQHCTPTRLTCWKNEMNEDLRMRGQQTFPLTIHFNMWTVSLDISIQRRHWQPLSVHLWAYCTHPTHDVNKEVFTFTTPTRLTCWVNEMNEDLRMRGQQTSPLTIHFNMWTVSSDISIQRCHWQQLSVHLWAYCTPQPMMWMMWWVKVDHNNGVYVPCSFRIVVWVLLPPSRTR